LYILSAFGQRPEALNTKPISLTPLSPFLGFFIINPEVVGNKAMTFKTVFSFYEARP